MRILSLLLAVGLCAPMAWAKMIKVSKGSIDANQLHDELLSRFPEWRGTQKSDGSYVDPLLRVEHDASNIILEVPDEANEATVQSVVISHSPKPTSGKSRQDTQDTMVAPPLAEFEELEARVTKLEALLEFKSKTE